MSAVRYALTPTGNAFATKTRGWDDWAFFTGEWICLAVLTVMYRAGRSLDARAARLRRSSGEARGRDDMGRLVRTPGATVAAADDLLLLLLLLSMQIDVGAEETTPRILDSDSDE